MKNPRLLHEEIYIYITQLRDQRCVYSSTLPIHGNSNAANSHVNFFTGHHANHAIPGAIHFGAPLAIYGRHNPTVDQAYLLVVISLSYKLYVLVHVLCEWLTALWSLELMQCTTVCWVPTLLSCPCWKTSGKGPRTNGTRGMKDAFMGTATFNSCPLRLVHMTATCFHMV